MGEARRRKLRGEYPEQDRYIVCSSQNELKRKGYILVARDGSITVDYGYLSPQTIRLKLDDGLPRLSFQVSGSDMFYLQIQKENIESEGLPPELYAYLPFIKDFSRLANYLEDTNPCQEDKCVTFLVSFPVQHPQILGVAMDYSIGGCSHEKFEELLFARHE